MTRLPALPQRIRVAALVLGVLALPALIPLPADAYYTPTICTLTLDPGLAPGLSATGSAGTFSSGGSSGVADCDGGTVDGQAVTGPGTFDIDGRYGTTDPDTCLSGGEGTGVVTFTVPTGRGPRTVTDTVTFTYGPLQQSKPLGGAWQGEATAGTFEISVPMTGECLARPLRQVHLAGRYELFRGA